jgi:hypothetical protein
LGTVDHVEQRASLAVAILGTVHSTVRIAVAPLRLALAREQISVLALVLRIKRTVLADLLVLVRAPDPPARARA